MHFRPDLVPGLEALHSELKNAKNPSSIIIRLTSGVKYTAQCQTVNRLKDMEVRDDAEDLGCVYQTYKQCWLAVVDCQQRAARVVNITDGQTWLAKTESQLFQQWRLVVGQILLLSQMLQMADFTNIAPMLLNTADRKAIAIAALVPLPPTESTQDVEPRQSPRTVTIRVPEVARETEAVVVSCQVEFRRTAKTYTALACDCQERGQDVVVEVSRATAKRRSMFSFWKPRSTNTASPATSTHDLLPRYDDVVDRTGVEATDRKGDLFPL